LSLQRRLSSVEEAIATVSTILGRASKSGNGAPRAPASIELSEALIDLGEALFMRFAQRDANSDAGRPKADALRDAAREEAMFCRLAEWIDATWHRGHVALSSDIVKGVDEMIASIGVQLASN